GKPEAIILVYRRTEDMLPGEEWPTASAHRTVAARVRRRAGRAVILRLFNRPAYEAWRGGRTDTRDLRLEWAESPTSLRFAIDWGVDRGADGRPIQQSLGWAAWLTGQDAHA